MMATYVATPNFSGNFIIYESKYMHTISLGRTAIGFFFAAYPNKLFSML